MKQRKIGRLTSERRRGSRRDEDARETIANHFAFDKHERRQLKDLERRRNVRRNADLRERLASLGG